MSRGFGLIFETLSKVFLFALFCVVVGARNFCCLGAFARDSVWNLGFFYVLRCGIARDFVPLFALRVALFGLWALFAFVQLWARVILFCIWILETLASKKKACLFLSLFWGSADYLGVWQK